MCKKNILMFVITDLNMDPRVQRCANSVSELGNLTLVTCGNSGFESDKYKIHEIQIKTKNNILHYFIFVFKLIRFIFKKKYDVVYAHDFFCALPLIILKLLGKSRIYIYDAHELTLPSESTKFSLRNQFFYLMEKFAIKKSDLVICAHEKRAEIMKNHYKLQNIPIVIRNISYLPMNDNVDNVKKQIFSEFLKKNGTTIVYAGRISTNRKIEKIVDYVINSSDEYKLVLIGPLHIPKNTVFDQIRDNSIKNILYLGHIKYSEMAYFLEFCDIGYLSYPNKGLNNIYCASNKIYEYASVGLVMIATYNLTLKYELETNQIGVSDDDIEAALKKVKTNYDLLKSNQKEFLQKNTWGKESDKLKNAILQVL